MNTVNDTASDPFVLQRITAIVDEVMLYLKSNSISSDARLHFSSSRRRLGFLWHYTATENRTYPCWWIGGDTDMSRLVLRSDGKIGLVIKESSCWDEKTNRRQVGTWLTDMTDDAQQYVVLIGLLGMDGSVIEPDSHTDEMVNIALRIVESYPMRS
jgi:hypothetical protein